VSDDVYRVMVVDDDADLANLTSEIIRRRIHADVLTITNPLLAREAGADFGPDVVVTDIEMPGLTGLALLAQMRDDEPGLPFIVMTGHLSTEYALTAMRSQANEMLTKPVSSAKLAEVVTRLAQDWRRAQAAKTFADRAAEVQHSLLPTGTLSLPGYDLAGGCVTAQTVGGDFYDWYPTESGAALTLADVMGKGVGAAIIAATVRAVLRSHSKEENVSRAVSAAAAELTDDLGSASAFVTMLHARLDAETGEVRYVDAGHALSLIVRETYAERLASPCLPIGVEANGDWRENSTTLMPGDTFVTVSDGVLDLGDGTLATLDMVEAIVRAARSSQEIVDVILKMAGTDAPDDVTVVVLRRESA
jgi:phosphoserine phosphatase RsbU/P